MLLCVRVGVFVFMIHYRCFPSLLFCHIFILQGDTRKRCDTHNKILSATPTEKSCFSATDTKNTWWCSRKRNVSIMTASFLKNLFFKSRPPNGFSVILSKKEKASDAVQQYLQSFIDAQYRCNRHIPTPFFLPIYGPCATNSPNMLIGLFIPVTFHFLKRYMIVYNICPTMIRYIVHFESKSQLKIFLNCCVI